MEAEEETEILAVLWVVCLFVCVVCVCVEKLVYFLYISKMISLALLHNIYESNTITYSRIDQHGVLYCLYEFPVGSCIWSDLGEHFSDVKYHSETFWIRLYFRLNPYSITAIQYKKEALIRMCKRAKFDRISQYKY